MWQFIWLIGSIYFMVNGLCYQFRRLPFGLSTASSMFSKCLSEVIAYLRGHGLQVCPFLDNWLSQWAHFPTGRFTQFFSCFPIQVSQSTATNLFPPLLRGARLDSVLSKVYFPQERFYTIKHFISNLYSQPKKCLRICLTLLDHMAACPQDSIFKTPPPSYSEG